MAQRFQFGLDKLLEMRKGKEEESKILFTESQRAKKHIEEKLESLKDDYDRYKGIVPGEDVVYQKLKRYYLQGLQNGIKSTEKDLVLKNQEVDSRRNDLAKKQMDRKTVETLKDKKYAEFIKEQERIEQINIDELALYAFMRNKEL